MTVPLGATAAGMDAALHVEQTVAGHYRVTCEQAPGWAAVARTPIELARATAEGFREARIAAYAESRRQPYDLAMHDAAAADAAKLGKLLPVDPDARAAVIAGMACAVLTDPAPVLHSPSDTYDPLAWKPLDGGVWLSPAGRRYGPQTQVVARVVAKRAAMGIGTVPR